MNTKTLTAGEAHDYKIGDLVDFFRTQSTNDVSGWKGPAKIIDNTNISRGTVTVRHERDFPIEVRLQDARRHLEYLVLLAARGSLREVGAVGWDDVRAILDRRPLG